MVVRPDPVDVDGLADLGAGRGCVLHCGDPFLGLREEPFAHRLRRLHRRQHGLPPSRRRPGWDRRSLRARADRCGLPCRGRSARSDRGRPRARPAPQPSRRPRRPPRQRCTSPADALSSIFRKSDVRLSLHRAGVRRTQTKRGLRRAGPVLPPKAPSDCTTVALPRRARPAADQPMHAAGKATVISFRMANVPRGTPEHEASPTSFGMRRSPEDPPAIMPGEGASTRTRSRRSTRTDDPLRVQPTAIRLTRRR